MEKTRTNPYRRITALLKLGYTELQYWLLGMTPEGYHFQQSRNYERFGSVERAAHHSRQVLRYAEYPEPRARLGHYYAMRGSYVEAVEHYRKAISTWPHPSILLALAQAEVRIGNHQSAIDLIGQVEDSEMKEQLATAIAEVRSELKTANLVLAADKE